MRTSLPWLIAAFFVGGGLLLGLASKRVQGQSLLRPLGLSAAASIGLLAATYLVSAHLRELGQHFPPSLLFLLLIGLGVAAAAAVAYVLLAVGLLAGQKLRMSFRRGPP